MSLSLATRGGEQGKQGYLVSFVSSSIIRSRDVTSQFHRQSLRPMLHVNDRLDSTLSFGKIATRQSGSLCATATWWPSLTLLL